MSKFIPSRKPVTEEELLEQKHGVYLIALENGLCKVGKTTQSFGSRFNQETNIQLSVEPIPATPLAFVRVDNPSLLETKIMRDPHLSQYKVSGKELFKVDVLTIVKVLEVHTMGLSECILFNSDAAHKYGVKLNKGRNKTNIDMSTPDGLWDGPYGKFIYKNNRYTSLKYPDLINCSLKIFGDTLRKIGHPNSNRTHRQFWFPDGEPKFKYIG